MEMQSWVEIYNSIPTEYSYYLSVPHSNECPTRAEINSKLTNACTTDSNELADQASIALNFSERPRLTSDPLAENWQHDSTTQRDIQLRYGKTYLLNKSPIGEDVQDYISNYVIKVTGQYQYFEILQLDRGILRVRPLFANQTNMMRTCAVTVTAMGEITYISLSQYANPLST